jgi:hypothetical protein
LLDLDQLNIIMNRFELLFKVYVLYYQSLAGTLFTLSNKLVDKQDITDYPLLIKPVNIYWLDLFSDFSPQLQFQSKYAIV